MELNDRPIYPKIRPFLLMEGGPLYRIEQRIGLIKANPSSTIRGALIVTALTWIPLLLLSFLHGTAFGNSVTVPFLRDFSAHSRFLVAVPLLLLAELLLGPRIAEAAEYFVLSSVIQEKDYKRFDSAIESGLRLRDSVIAEIILAIFAYSISWVAFRQLAVHQSTWYALRTADGLSLTLAGWWLILFSVPLFHFLLLRWLWRVFLWFRFLHAVSKLSLNLYPTHPDKAGGLGFVGKSQRFFGILFFAYTCGAAGVVANDILFDKIPLQHFTPIIVIYALFVILINAAPLVVFTPRLLSTKRHGLHEYGTLATTYTGSFQRKWIEGKNPSQESLLGTADIQSLADLGNSYEFIENMKPIPVDPKGLLQLVVLALLPLSLLLLTIMSFKDVIKLLMKVLM